MYTDYKYIKKKNFFDDIKLFTPVPQTAPIFYKCQSLMEICGQIKNYIHGCNYIHGRSMDNVHSELGIDRTNPWIAGHLNCPRMLLIPGTGKGERGTGNGEGGTGNGERGTGNGERGTGNGSLGTSVQRQPS